MVRAATSALTIASSTLCAVASKSGEIRSFDSIATVDTESGRKVAFAVEKAMKMSPDVLAPMPPLRAMPSDARFAMRLSWCGRSGASVATTMMIDP